MSSFEQTRSQGNAGSDWVPVAGVIYASLCPVSEKYFHPFRHLLGYHQFYGFARIFEPTGNSFVTPGAMVLRLLLIIPFLVAITSRETTIHLHWRAVSAGMYWALIISTFITVGNSSYGIVWTWLLVPIHVILAIVACGSVNRSGSHLGRWQWLGAVYGLAAWIAANWL